jgi:MFS family permease
VNAPAADVLMPDEHLARLLLPDSPRPLEPAVSVGAVASSSSPLLPAASPSTPRQSQSILGILVTALLQSMSFTIILPSILFYLRSVGGADHSLGIIVAAYSLGGFASSSAFGWWSDVALSTRIPLLASLLISIGGNVWYALLYLMPNPPVQLIVARFVIGIASGAPAGAARLLEVSLLTILAACCSLD